MEKTTPPKAKISSYTDLIVWQKSHELILRIYELVQKFPADEKYNLVSQIKRVSLAIPTNIVGGFSKWSSKDSLYYYNIADSSLSELSYFCYLSKDFGFIKKSDLDELNEKIEDCTKLLRSWIKGIKEREAKWKAKKAE